MYRTVIAMPLLPGKTEADVRRVGDRFRQEPEAYTESRRRLGVSLERAYLQHAEMGDFLVAYLESDDPFPEITRRLVESDLPLDRFFVESAQDLYGMDMSQGSPGTPPETVATWADPAVTTRRRGMAFTAPLRPGKTEAGRAFAVDAFARDDMTRSRRGRHENLEVVTLLRTPQGDAVAVYIEGDDPFASNVDFAASDDPFDVWFKGELAELFPPAIDFGQPVPGVRELFDSADLMAKA